jgi:hypothetical protein
MRSLPRHETTEKPYARDAARKSFHDAVLDYCLHIVTTSGADQHHRRLWGTLALMRCVGSSPAAEAEDNGGARSGFRAEPAAGDGHRSVGSAAEGVAGDAGGGFVRIGADWGRDGNAHLGRRG